MSKFSFRWGIADLDDGHTVVYNFMLRHYAEAGVTRDEFVCILHLASYRYESPEGKSKPSQSRIAKEMGYKHRNSINMLIHSLKAKGMLITTGGKGFVCEYNFAPFSRRTLELDRDAQATVQVDAQATVQVDAQAFLHEEVKPKNKEGNKGYTSRPKTKTNWPEIND